MSRVPSKDPWQPSASIDALKQRHQLLQRLRAFFEARGVWEVETPMLSRASAVDLQLAAMSVQVSPETTGYLHTSPEFPLKRLLAAGSGSIFQISKVFRQDECGQRHNPEFTMLEWYRVGFTLPDLMAETDVFLQTLLGTPSAEVVTWQALFEQWAGVNPHTAKADTLWQRARDTGLWTESQPSAWSEDDWLDWIFVKAIEPTLGHERPLFVTDFPAKQAALAKTREVDGLEVASRFEVYIQGLELANGYDELTDAKELRRRMTQDNAHRAAVGKPVLPIDENLLAAMTHGLPPCAGIALGVDRLVMLALSANHIEDVLSFDWARA